jgi:hypothetical protein
MGLFNRFRPELPEVPVSDALKNRIGAHCDALGSPADPEKLAKAARYVIHEELYPISKEFRAKAPVNPDALEMHLMLCIWAGMAAQVAEEHGWTKGLATALPAATAMREYIAFSRRKEWDKGPVPLVVYAQQQNNGETDPVHATLGVMAQLLGLTGRNGGLEGFFRLGILCWMAGEVMGAKLELQDAPPETGAEPE